MGCPSAGAVFSPCTITSTQRGSVIPALLHPNPAGQAPKAEPPAPGRGVLLALAQWWHPEWSPFTCLVPATLRDILLVSSAWAPHPAESFRVHIGRLTLGPLPCHLQGHGLKKAQGYRDRSGSFPEPPGGGKAAAWTICTEQQTDWRHPGCPSAGGWVNKLVHPDQRQSNT